MELVETLETPVPASSGHEVGYFRRASGNFRFRSGIVEYRFSAYRNFPEADPRKYLAPPSGSRRDALLPRAILIRREPSVPDTEVRPVVLQYFLAEAETRKDATLAASACARVVGESWTEPRKRYVNCRHGLE